MAGSSAVCDLEAASRLKTDDLHEPLSGSAFQILHNHGHRRDDRAYRQREAAYSLHALCVPYVMQARLFDRIAFTRVVELGTILSY
jgi:hypothetical protein